MQPYPQNMHSVAVNFKLVFLFILVHDPEDAARRVREREAERDQYQREGLVPHVVDYGDDGL